MKLFGSVKELFSAVFRADGKEVTLRPNATIDYSGVDVVIDLPPSTADQVLVGATSTQTLTNKTISGASNTVTNVSLTTGVTGTLPIGNGGTGQTTANSALNALLPSQASNSGRVLQTNGTDTSWAVAATVVTTTRGDLIARDATQDARLPIGAASRVLTSNGTDPSWNLLVNSNIDAAAAIEGSKVASASGSVAGVVDTTTQTFAGNKTFSGDVSVTGTGGNISTGSYTPTLTGDSNTSGTTARLCYWMRIQNQVFVTGRFTADPVSAGVSTTVGISLPIASNFGNTLDASGTSVSDTFNPGYILADVANDRVTAVYTPTGTANSDHQFTFMYRII